MPASQQHTLHVLARTLGIRDPDDLYLYGFAVVDLVIAAAIYLAVTKLGRMTSRP